jgi:hypothetical protein
MQRYLLSLLSVLMFMAGCEGPPVDERDKLSKQAYSAPTEATPASYAGKVYDESNFEELVGDGEKVWCEESKRFYNLSRKEPPKAEQEQRYKAFGDSLKTFSRPEIVKRAKDQAATKSRVSDWITFKAYNQSQTNYCWANGPAQSFTTTRLMQGLPLRIISAASVGGPITGYRNVGGWEWDAAEYLMKTGGTTTDNWPNAAISRSYNTDAVTQDRPNYTGLELIQCKTFDEFATCCVLGYTGAVAYDWWSHVVQICDVVVISESPLRLGFRLRNSWDDNWGDKNDYGVGGFTVLAEGKGTPSSGFMWKQVTPSAAPVKRSFSLVSDAEPAAAPKDRRILVFTTTPCDPCEKLKTVAIPKLREVGWTVDIVKDTDFPSCVKHYKIDGFPTTIALLGDEEIGRLEGYHTAAEIADMASKDPADKQTGLFFRRRRPASGGCSKCFAAETQYWVAV